MCSLACGDNEYVGTPDVKFGRAALTALVVALVAVGSSFTSAQALSSAPPRPAQANPALSLAGAALPEWSGTVLGGTEIALPAKNRSISFASIHPGANFTLGIDTNGFAWSWGVNGFGQLGNDEYIGHYIFAPYPVAVMDTAGEQLRAIDVAAGGNFSVALDESGLAWSYGRNNFGQLGNPIIPTGSAYEGSVAPVAVVDAAGNQMTFASVDTGTNFAFGLQADGTAWAWGRNWSGNLGAESNAWVGMTPVSTVATPVLGPDDQPMHFRQISGGEDFAIGIDLDGKAWGWGENGSGATGSPGPDSSRPRPILDEHGDQMFFTEVSAGYASALGLDANGGVWSWGRSTGGMLGNPSVTGDTAVPVPVLDPAGNQLTATTVSIKSTTAYARDANGHVWAWGTNEYGQLSIDPAALPATNVPVQAVLSDGSPVVADRVYAGLQHVTVQGAFDPTTHSNARAWGAAWFGQLGDPDADTSASAFSPQPVPIALAQPSSESIVYFGDDDDTGVTGTVVGDTLLVNAPHHLAGRVPVYVAWFGDEPTRELVGYFTFMLNLSLVVDPLEANANTPVTLTTSLPDEEIPLIGDAQAYFNLHPTLAPVPGAPGDVPVPVAFDTAGKASMQVTAAVRGTYYVGVKAYVDYRGDTPPGDLVAVSAEVRKPTVFKTPVSTKWGRVTINKVDTNNDPLTGAKFKVYASHLNDPDLSVTGNPDTGLVETSAVCDMTTSGATSCSFSMRYSDYSEGVQLSPGDYRWNYYYIVEAQAPEGFELNTVSHPFEVTATNTIDDEIPPVTIVNAPRSIDLPAAGSSPALLAFAAAGLLLIGLATAFTVNRFRRR